MGKENDKLISAKALYDINQYFTSISAVIIACSLLLKLCQKGFKSKTHADVILFFSLRESTNGIDESIAKDCISKAELFMNESERFI